MSERIPTNPEMAATWAVAKERAIDMYELLSWISGGECGCGKDYACDPCRAASMLKEISEAAGARI